MAMSVASHWHPRTSKFWQGIFREVLLQAIFCLLTWLSRSSVSIILKYLVPGGWLVLSEHMMEQISEQTCIVSCDSRAKLGCPDFVVFVDSFLSSAGV